MELSYNHVSNHLVMRLFTRGTLFLTLLSLTACGSPAPTTENIQTWTGSIILNPTHLVDQSDYMLVQEDNNLVVAYIDSTEVPLEDYLDQAGTVTGKITKQTADQAPTLLVDQFTPAKPLTQEDIILRAAKVESQRAPYTHTWSESLQMLVLQTDISSGSASVQIKDEGNTHIIRLVRNDKSWHIAGIEQVGYSPVESGTGATETAVSPEELSQ